MTRDDLKSTGNETTDEIVRAAIRVVEGYNGWPNRETWNTHLWMTNDERLYQTAYLIARQGDAYDAAKALKDWWDRSHWPTAGGPLQDAWTYAVNRTDWDRIIEAFRED